MIASQPVRVHRQINNVPERGGVFLLTTGEGGINGTAR